MIAQIIGGIVRAVMAAYGGRLVEQGMLTDQQLTQGIGAVLVLITIGWSVWQKSRARTVPGGEFNPEAPVKKAQEIGDRKSEIGKISLSLLLSLAGIFMFWFALTIAVLHWCMK